MGLASCRLLPEDLWAKARGSILMHLLQSYHRLCPLSFLTPHIPAQAPLFRLFPGTQVAETRTLPRAAGFLPPHKSGCILSYGTKGILWKSDSLMIISKHHPTPHQAQAHPQGSATFHHPLPPVRIFELKPPSFGTQAAWGGKSPWQGSGLWKPWLLCDMTQREFSCPLRDCTHRPG